MAEVGEIRWNQRDTPFPPIIPAWKKWDPEEGRWIFGVEQWAIELVHNGYACGNCLEQFVTEDRSARRQLDVGDPCPVCRVPVERRSVETPPEWVEYIEEHKRRWEAEVERQERMKRRR